MYNVYITFSTMKIIIYHNPRCRKSRAGLEWVKNYTSDIEIVDYIGNGISPAVLKKLAQQLNLKITDLVRTQEDIYKKQLKGKNFSDEEWLQIISENPKLIKRPIVVKGNKAVIGENEDICRSFFE